MYRPAKYAAFTLACLLTQIGYAAQNKESSAESKKAAATKPETAEVLRAQARKCLYYTSPCCGAPLCPDACATKAKDEAGQSLVQESIAKKPSATKDDQVSHLVGKIIILKPVE